MVFGARTRANASATCPSSSRSSVNHQPTVLPGTSPLPLSSGGYPPLAIVTGQASRSNADSPPHGRRWRTLRAGNPRLFAEARGPDFLMLPLIVTSPDVISPLRRGWPDFTVGMPDKTGKATASVTRLSDRPAQMISCVFAINRKRQLAPDTTTLFTVFFDVPFASPKTFSLMEFIIRCAIPSRWRL